MPSPWNIPVAAGARLPDFREAVNDALLFLLAGITTTIVVKTATADLLADEYFIVCPTGSFQLTLPATADLPIRPRIIKNQGPGTITVLAAGDDTIDGEESYELVGANQCVTVWPDGSNWIVTASLGSGGGAGVGSAGAMVCILDNSGFDGVETVFSNALPTEPELTAPRRVVLLHSGVGPLELVESAPGAGQFSLGGFANRTPTYGFAPEAGDVVIAVYVDKISGSPGKLIPFGGYVGTFEAGATFGAWTTPIACTLQAGLPLLGGAVEVPFTNPATLDIQREGLSIGSIHIAAGADPAITCTFDDDVELPSLGGFKVVQPAVLDPTGAGVDLTIPGVA